MTGYLVPTVRIEKSAKRSKQARKERQRRNTATAKPKTPQLAAGKTGREMKALEAAEPLNVQLNPQPGHEVHVKVVPAKEATQPASAARRALKSKPLAIGAAGVGAAAAGGYFAHKKLKKEREMFPVHKSRDRREGARRGAIIGGGVSAGLISAQLGAHTADLREAGVPRRTVARLAAKAGAKGLAIDTATGTLIGAAIGTKRKRKPPAAQVGKASDRDRRRAQGAAMTGAGATTAGVGLVAGGVPGVKANHGSFVLTPEQKKARDSLPPLRRAASQAKAAKATPGGILGFRISAHRGALYGYKQSKTADDWAQPGGPLHDKKAPPTTAAQAYNHGRRAGRVEPEERVLRHMKGAKAVAGAALVGGTGLAAAGAHRSHSAKKKPVKKDSQQAHRRAGALAGAGGAATALTYGGTRVLRGQAQAWDRKAVAGEKEAGRLVPKIAGRSKEHIQDHPELFRGTGKKVARQAGELRGAATQHEHFAEVYRDTGKIVGRLRTPSAVAAAAGVGGLAALKTRDKKRVKKSFKQLQAIKYGQKMGDRSYLVGPAAQRFHAANKQVGNLRGAKTLDQRDWDVRYVKGVRGTGRLKPTMNVYVNPRQTAQGKITKGLPRHLSDIAPAIHSSQFKVHGPNVSLPNRQDYVEARVRAHEQGKIAARLKSKKAKPHSTGRGSDGVLIDRPRNDGHARAGWSADERSDLGQSMRELSRSALAGNTPIVRPKSVKKGLPKLSLKATGRKVAEAKAQELPGHVRYQGKLSAADRRPARSEHELSKGLPRYLKDRTLNVALEAPRKYRGGTPLKRDDYSYLRTRAHLSGKKAGVLHRTWRAEADKVVPGTLPTNLGALEAARKPGVEAGNQGRFARVGSRKAVEDNTSTRRPRKRPLP